MPLTRTSAGNEYEDEYEDKHDGIGKQARLQRKRTRRTSPVAAQAEIVCALRHGSNVTARLCMCQQEFYVDVWMAI